MLFEKVYEITVNVDNPINFCTNKTKHVISEINNRYVGKCYKGSFIKELVKIIQISACNLVKTNNSGEAYVDVRFLAKVININQWDIIVGIEIKDIHQLIIGEYNKDFKASIAIDNKKADMVNINQICCVRVIKSIYKPMNDYISVFSTILTCDKNAPIYKVTGDLEPKNIKFKLHLLMEEVKNELELRKQMNKSDYLYFEQLLYSYKHKNKSEETILNKNGTEWTGYVCGNEVKNIIDIINTTEVIDVTGYWTRSLFIYRSSPNVSFMKTIDDETKFVEMSAYDVFAELLKNVYDFLKCIRQMVEIFPSVEIRNNHKNIWMMMKEQQLD